jgi:hypothetical protein
MRHKEFVITRIEDQSNLIESLIKALDSNVISKQKALQLLSNIRKNLELIIDRVSLEHDE